MLHRFAIVALCCLPIIMAKAHAEAPGDGDGRYTMSPSRAAYCASTKTRVPWRSAHAKATS